jgi:SAM-dependent methyltransferase
MNVKLAARIAKKSRSVFTSVAMSYPKRVECNICGWSGNRFLSDSWHDHINCPKCSSGVRHRLFFAALQNINHLSFEKLFHRKKILHFAPEKSVQARIRHMAGYYATADLMRTNCNFRVDMSKMPEINNEAFDVVIACDVLEHVPHYQKALEEVNRILSAKGWGIFTVPQKDHLSVTYENPSITVPEDRLKHFGQEDHLRIFGHDFPSNVTTKGFAVTVVDESCFSQEIVEKCVLFPPALSKHPLATNYRKIFFCQKTAS